MPESARKVRVYRSMVAGAPRGINFDRGVRETYRTIEMNYILSNDYISLFTLLSVSGSSDMRSIYDSAREAVFTFLTLNLLETMTASFDVFIEGFYLRNCVRLNFHISVMSSRILKKQE